MSWEGHEPRLYHQGAEMMTLTRDSIRGLKGHFKNLKNPKYISCSSGYEPSSLVIVIVIRIVHLTQQCCILAASQLPQFIMAVISNVLMSTRAMLVIHISMLLSALLNILAARICTTAVHVSQALN